MTEKDHELNEIVEKELYRVLEDPLSSAKDLDGIFEMYGRAETHAKNLDVQFKLLIHQNTDTNTLEKMISLAQHRLKGPNDPETAGKLRSIETVATSKYKRKKLGLNILIRSKDET